MKKNILHQPSAEFRLIITVNNPLNKKEKNGRV